MGRLDPIANFLCPGKFRWVTMSWFPMGASLQYLILHWLQCMEEDATDGPAAAGAGTHALGKPLGCSSRLRAHGRTHKRGLFPSCLQNDACTMHPPGPGGPSAGGGLPGPHTWGSAHNPAAGPEGCFCPRLVPAERLGGQRESSRSAQAVEGGIGPSA